MSAFSDIVAGLVTVLQNNVTNLKGYDYLPDSVSQFPAAIVQPEPIDPEIAFGGNSFEADLRVTVLVASGDDAVGFRALWDHIDPTATNASIIKAVRSDRTLNGKADDADVVRIENIGRRETWGGWFFGFDALVHFIKSVA